VQQFFSDKIFFTTLFKLWLPITFQQLIFSLLSLLTVMMIGQLGETSVAAVGLANQIGFLFNLLLFGVGSGSAIFVAQFWGTRDIFNIRRTLGICLTVGLIGTGVFSFIAFAIPDLALAIYSTDPAVIALGSNYLRIAGASYLPIAITMAFTTTLRSTGNVRMPVAVSVFALSFGTALNYALIFGMFGLPALGVHGSAIGTAIARWIECVLMLALIYGNQLIVAAKVRELFTFDRAFLGTLLKTILPVMLNEIFWSLGVSMYNVIYGHISTEAIAAISITATIENLALVPFVGGAHASAIMIGNRIGANQEHQAIAYAKRFLQLQLAVGVCVGGIIFLATDPILAFYKIDPTTYEYARNVLIMLALTLWIKTGNMISIVGILRAGGDARVSALIDTIPLWLIGLPLTAIGAFVFGLPVYWVYLLTYSDELTKFILAQWRILSNKWINNLAQQHGAREA
jgi:putative MATE family efflux protein